MKPVRDLLRARLHPKRGKIGFVHERHLLNRNRINPACAAPAELEAALNDPAAHFTDALAIE